MVCAIAAVAAGGCGSDGDEAGSVEDSGSTAAARTVAKTTPTAAESTPIILSGERVEIQQTVDGFQDGIAKGSGKAVCASLSEDARATVGGGSADDCPAQARAALSQQPTDKRWETTEVRGIVVHGDQATATSQDRDSAEIYGVRLVQENSAWRLAGVAFDRPSGLLVK